MNKLHPIKQMNLGLLCQCLAVVLLRRYLTVRD